MTPYEIGQFVGAAFACGVLRAILGWVAAKWPPSVTRLAFVNLFSFFVASWLYAHGISLSAAQDIVKISVLHAYFFPQLVIFSIDLCVYFFRLRFRLRRSGEVEKDHPARIEPTL